MTPSQLLSTLAAGWPAQRRFLIVGKPGQGKTAIVTQAAKATNHRLILSHPAVEDPTSAAGLPFIVGGQADFLPFGQMRQAIEATEPTIWFWDDFGQATPATRCAYMQILHGGRLNGHVISPYVTICAATNSRLDKSGVTGMEEAVKSRFHAILNMETSLACLTAYALDHNWRPDLIAFLRSFPDLVNAFTPTADFTNSPTPRTWEALNSLMELNLSQDVVSEVLGGAVGQAAATQYLTYVAMYAQLANVDAILLNPMTAKIPTKTDQLYAICSALAFHTTPANFGRVAQYIDRLIEAKHTEFATLLIRDGLRRTQDAIATTSAFIRLVTRPELAAIFGAATR